MKYALAYDIGTTGVKTCLFEIDKEIRLIGAANEGYELYIFEDGGAEQDPDEWWQAMINTTKKVLKTTKIKPELIDGISFCSQMQGLVLVDKDGLPVRRAMSYMDQRARKELKENMAYGLQVAGGNVVKVLKSLAITVRLHFPLRTPYINISGLKVTSPKTSETYINGLTLRSLLLQE